ncbi:glycosyl transferase family 1 [Haloprofundus marisrubri]|uniref:Glycosyl transferase family 1 n=1 Tax=Haloprofundus marisrubri TaxID=1514971 RepID=A0A0W1R572_9EURY|nr:glycosyltransferase family 4 protein [Haloprofundus marisrubri]KTG08395.1 glycosyl transferase family 1 [Haloprofundus marisrubri]
MRVLQLITSTRSFFEQQVEALEAQGVDCTVVSVPAEYSPDSPRTVRDYLRYYPEVLAEGLDSYDLVHANYGLTVPFALAQPTRPLVLTLWGTDIMGEYGWLRHISKMGARAADETVLPSRAMASHLGENYTHLPFGVDTDRFRPIDRTEARERIGWDEGEKVALFPYEKSRDEKDYPRAQAVVDAADTDVTLRTISNVPYEEMPYYMNASDALLVTSQRESGPMVVKEAAACGLPVVSTDVGFVRDEFGDAPGVAVGRTNDELASGLDRLVAEVDSLSDRERRRSVSPDVSVDRMGERLASLYECVAQGAA